MRLYILAIVLLFSAVATIANGAELRRVGVLGNSGESGQSLVKFEGKPAPAIGPVFDSQSTLWERGGAKRLNRYSLDGRLLASFELPESTDRNDEMTLVGDVLLLKLRGVLYTLNVNSQAGDEPKRLVSSIDAMSSSSHDGKVAVYEKKSDQLSWFEPATEARTPIAQPGFSMHSLHVGDDGTVYAFAAGKVYAWKDAQPVANFPQGINGDSPQKIGDFWYSHSWHGTIHRLNERFEPAPGVVLGGASGSFIGYLPQSVDLTKGHGLVHIRNNIFAVSGHAGIIQLLVWNNVEMRFEVARRIGSTPELSGVAINDSGVIWTPFGSCRWEDSCEVPYTLGDKQPDVHAQPVMLGGKTLSLLKKHYSYVQLARGPLIDASGWSHLETPGVKDFALPDSVTGAAAVSKEGRLSLVVAQRDGNAFEIAISSDGRQLSAPASTTISGLKDCTSLAWFNDQLYAADSGRVIAFQRDPAGGWKQMNTLFEGDDEVFIHSDGVHLAVSDADKGELILFDSSLKQIANSSELNHPTHVAIAGNRLVVYEAGNQRLLKLTLTPAVAKANLTAKQSPQVDGDFPQPADVDFQDLTRPGGIPMQVALVEGNAVLSVSVRTPGSLAPKIRLGVANEKQAFVLTTEDAQHSNGQYSFRLPAGDWSTIRLAAAITLPHQQERFGFADHRAIHAPFSSNTADWSRFDIEGYRERTYARREEIRITFEQPVNGKATIVIEDENARRVRNLLSARSFSAGKQTLIWDGLDEQGRLVSPGRYRWRGITHKGLEPVYKMNFANGGEPTTASWGPNHSTLQSAACNGKLVFFAAPVTEGGWALMALNSDGEFVQGYEHIHGYGIGHDAIAADDTYLYCAQDGFIWGGTKDVELTTNDWTATWKVTLVRYDIKTGKLVEWPGKQRAIEVDAMQVGPGSAHPDLKEFNLAGLAVHAGKLYIGSRDEKAVLVLNAETGKRIESIDLAGVRQVAAGEVVYAATDQGVVRLSDGKEVLAAGEMDITGLAIAPAGDLFVSNGKLHQIHQFTPAGKSVKTIGEPGGPYKGVYNPKRMVNPTGLVLGPAGKLWVTENRWNPKRVMAWDLKQNAVVYEKFGMPHYGGDGSGFDPENPRRWIGLGCFWDVDIEKKTAQPTHIFAINEGHFVNYHPHSYQFFREGGRTFVCARGKISLISEVLDDGTLHDIVGVAGTHHFAYGCNWDPPQAYIDAFYEKWPQKRKGEASGRKGQGKPWAQRGMGVMWVDRNGDGEPQKEEFSFCGDDIHFAGGAWGHLQNSLTLYMPLEHAGQVRVAAIRPNGLLENKVPNYPALEKAIANAAPISLTPGYKRSGVATARDRFGRFIFNSDPEMNAFQIGGDNAKTSEKLWDYPNQWSDVHGSHKAPLPEPGVMQGVLGILGLATFDDRSDLMFLNGNHGRCFVLTTDGLYLDEAFVDVRVSYLKNEYRLGGEIFGGSFDRSHKDGKYYVQIGHGPYRIYELTGLDSAQRIAGDIVVSKAQILVAEQQSLRRVAEKQLAKRVSLPGDVSWDKNGKFPVQVKMRRDETHLHLEYRVQDSSPWVNNGRDWTKLFATGDTVDFQFGVDPSANANRKGPVVGDKRLLIAEYEGEPIAVLYEHRLPKAKNSIEFTSPWRGEKVDNVERLTDAAIEVKADKRGYVVTATVPLSSLHWKPKAGVQYRADFGVTYGDAQGTETNLRSYWSNQSTGLVDDIPGEVMLSPHLWGELNFTKGRQD
ncbi:MAG: hypothetical protein NXI22_04650 [bacterium]|nr:hypothetical protein [bacterium]